MSYPRRTVIDEPVYYLKTIPSTNFPGKVLIIMDPDGHVARINPDGTYSNTPDNAGADGPENQCIFAGVFATFTPAPGHVAATIVALQTDPA